MAAEKAWEQDKAAHSNQFHSNCTEGRDQCKKNIKRAQDKNCSTGRGILSCEFLVKEAPGASNLTQTIALAHGYPL